MIARSLLRYANRSGNPNYNHILNRFKYTEVRWLDTDAEEKVSNMDLVLLHEKEQGSIAKPSRFPFISNLGVVTEGKDHKFEVSCDKVLRMIKMGTVNKNLAVQYCHYLVHISQETADTSLKTYYAAKALELMRYILKHHKDLLFSANVMLIGDVSNASLENCSHIRDHIFDQIEFPEKFPPSTLRELLKSCYKFAIYDFADKILKFSPTTLNPLVFDAFVVGLHKFSSDYKLGVSSEPEKTQVRQNFIVHLNNLIDVSSQKGVQFITKYDGHLIEALQNLDIEVVRNPVIKNSRRCTSCNSILPGYDERFTPDINRAIKSTLEVKVNENGFLHTSPQDMKAFVSFLEKLQAKDGKPLDCVIDGLNIAYQNASGYIIHSQKITNDFTRTFKSLSPESLAQVFINTIIRGGFTTRFKKILIVGRKHMHRWPGVEDFLKSQQIYYYFSFDHSKDDLFSLYATTLSPKTILITNDFLRDHKALLSDEMRAKFERFLETRQGWIVRKNLKPIWPTPVAKLPSIDHKTGHFHIPIINSNRFVDLGKHEPPPHLNSNMTSWICCRPKKLSKE